MGDRGLLVFSVIAYIDRGVNEVHSINGNVLLIISGRNEYVHA
jgi:hypothetical protein